MNLTPARRAGGEESTCPNPAFDRPRVRRARASPRTRSRGPPAPGRSTASGRRFVAGDALLEVGCRAWPRARSSPAVDRGGVAASSCGGSRRVRIEDRFALGMQHGAGMARGHVAARPVSLPRSAHRSRRASRRSPGSRSPTPGRSSPTNRGRASRRDLPGIHREHGRPMERARRTCSTNAMSSTHVATFGNSRHPVRSRRAA